MKIHTRAELGSRPFRTTPPTVALSERRFFVVHYPGAGTPPRGLKELRAWVERIHMDQNGWRSAGYNFVIDAGGNVGEGCGRDVVGAHSPPRNRDGIGVMLWTSDGKTTDAAMKACVDLLEHLEGQAGRKLTKTYHGEHYATECPGPQLRAWVEDGMPSPAGDTKPKPKPTPAPKPKPSGWDGKSFPGAGAFKIGQSHPAVTVLGQRLVAHGFGGRYKVGPGPRFSEVDRLATQDFQLAQGYKGTQKGGGADGYPGPQTWAALVKAPKAKAKPKPKGKTVGQLAQEVIDGKWGNDPERSRKLKAAGHDPKKVQAEVNRRLR